MNTAVSPHTANTSVSATSAKQALGASVNIPPRRMDFEFDPATLPRYYYGNDPFCSTFMTAFSSLLPEGERFFVEAVRHYRDQITDPILKAQISGFIGQEAMHSKEHEAFNAAATAQGYPVDQLDKAVGGLLRLGQKILPWSAQLAITVALEHYTAIIAEMLLRDENVQQKFSPEMRHLWMWHAVEENEHKVVAYDVYEKAVGNYALRVGVMVPVTTILFAVQFAYHARLLAHDGNLFKLRDNWASFKYLWNGKKGVFSRLLPQYLDYYKRDFHPNNHDTTELLSVWREKLFGAQGLIPPKTRKPAAKKQAVANVH